MERGHVILNNAQRYEEEYRIPQEKIDKAIAAATAKVERWIDEHGATAFASTHTVDYKYEFAGNTHWQCGLHTGCLWLAYELTGNEKFREAAKAQLKTYRERLDMRVGVDDHDVGFVFTPSCVAAYKLLGDKEAYRSALEAAEYFYNGSYSQKGGFVIRCAARASEEWACRTMMDTMLNIPLLFWAGEETGESKYTQAAISQTDFTANYLIREDGSSYHHYQCDVETHNPVRGVTHQGNRDESTWARGHAWGVLGFPIAYSYTKDESLFALQRDVTYYLLNHLPEDGIAYWDFDFTSGDEPRDSSANVIAVCGMLEMCKYLDDTVPEKKIYRNAAERLLDAVIDECTGDIGIDYDGLLYKATYARKLKPMDQYNEQCALYADYFYLEALMRIVNPDWKRYW